MVAGRARNETAAHRHRPADQETRMPRLTLLLKSFLLALMLAGAALAATEAPAQKVDINTADAATLAATLNGVGMAKAEAIVAHRKEHGPFKSAEQLAEVKGIGLKLVEKNRDRIQIGAASAPHQ
jgi:competence protein ComEA